LNVGNENFNQPRYTRVGLNQQIAQASQRDLNPYKQEIVYETADFLPK
jgi:hypothetical protein